MIQTLKYWLGINLNCKEAHQFLTDYVENALDEDLKWRFDQHRRLCRNCRVYLAQYKAVIALLHDTAPPKPQPELVAHTLSFLKNELNKPTS